MNNFTSLRKHPQFPYVVAIIIALLVGYGIGSASHGGDLTAPTAQVQQATPVATDAPTDTPVPATPTDTPVPPTATPAPVWTVTHTFKGNGNNKTALFVVPGDWKLAWACTNTSAGNTYNLIVEVTGSDNVMVDGAVNTICAAGNVSGGTEEHQGGNIYLNTTSEDAWTLTISELK